MSHITLTESQKSAIDSIAQWYNSEKQPVFRLYGYAGVGKTTIVRYAIDHLGLDDSTVFYATLTGKAAHVLRKKGVLVQRRSQRIQVVVAQGVEITRK